MMQLSKGLSQNMYDSLFVQINSNEAETRTALCVFALRSSTAFWCMTFKHLKSLIIFDYVNSIKVEASKLIANKSKL